MSTEVTTEMMDITIARFMGGTRIQHPEQIFFSEDHFGYVCHKGHWWNENNLQYHTSWDWLMPVVEKIHGLAVAGDAINAITSEEIFTFSIFAPLKDVHAAVYQFITWYNKQNKNVMSE